MRQCLDAADLDLLPDVPIQIEVVAVERAQGAEGLVAFAVFTTFETAAALAFEMDPPGWFVSLLRRTARIELRKAAMPAL